jgi:RNA polymerase sigma-70 factor (ECF subfamily)
LPERCGTPSLPDDGVPQRNLRKGSPLPGSITDDVLAAAQAGSGDAFAVIWRELAPVVVGYLATRGVADPEGTASDVFLALLPRLGELRGGAAGLRTFVFSIAHARTVDEIRRRERRPAVVEFDRVRHDRALPSAEDDALHRLGAERVQNLLQRLPADYREVLALRVLGDLSVEQAATVMRRSAGSVKQLQRRALLALRAEIAGGRVTGRGPDAITGAR